VAGTSRCDVRPARRADPAWPDFFAMREVCAGNSTASMSGNLIHEKATGTGIFRHLTPAPATNIGFSPDNPHPAWLFPSSGCATFPSNGRRDLFLGTMTRGSPRVARATRADFPGQAGGLSGHCNKQVPTPF